MIKLEFNHDIPTLDKSIDAIRMANLYIFNKKRPYKQVSVRILRMKSDSQTWEYFIEKKRNRYGF